MMWWFRKKDGPPRRKVHRQMVLARIAEVDKRLRGHQARHRKVNLSADDILVVSGARLKWREFTMFHGEHGMLQLRYGTERHVWEK